MPEKEVVNYEEGRPVFVMNETRTFPIRLSKIRIDDRFFNRYTKLVTKEIIPYQWKVLNDLEPEAEKSRCIANYRIAAGEEEGEFYGFVFQDSDLAKWLEAVAYSLSYEDNPELKKTADEAIALVERAQQKDGYLNTYFTVKEPGKQFTNLREGHELYCAGHMMEAAVAYYEVTGEDKLLKIMEKMADLIVKTFHEDKYKTAAPGHQEIEIGLVKMYRVTKKKEYLDMAKAFIDRRGTEPNYLVHEHEDPGWTDVFHNPDPFFPDYSQCDEPVRQQKTARGHAVREVYMLCAMADLAFYYRDEELFDACETLYDDIVNRQMYLTGGIGSSGLYERFTVDYDLPNDRNYSETCASIGLALFCRRMAEITGDTKYIETMETALYNTVLSGIGLDGKSFFYVNPMEVEPSHCLPHSSLQHVKSVRQKWFGCACCPPNIARTLASLGEYVCFTKENEVYLNLFLGCSFSVEFEGKKVDFTVETDMPYRGRTRIHVNNPENANGTLFLRIPSYAKKAELTDGENVVTLNPQKGYQKIEIKEKEHDLSLQFKMPAEYIYADPNVSANVGRVAVKKGPLVYCMEEADNGTGLSRFFVDTRISIVEDYDEDLFGGTMVITLAGEKLMPYEEEGSLYRTEMPRRKNAEARLIPYCLWGNRRTGEMLVWIRTNF